MRILVANEALRGGGGVETYLAAVVPALRSAGHEVGILHDNPLAEQGPQSIAPGEVWRVGVSDEGMDEAVTRVRTFAPDVCFSNNMRRLEIDRRLVAQWPVVKMMHGHFGTCVSGQKAFAYPAVVACGRSFGPACLGYYLPRRCGEARPLQIVRQYRWGLSQRSLFTQYSRIVVASRFMAEQYRHAGAEQGTVHVLPLFAPPSPLAMEGGARDIDVLFVGRLTNLKGPAIAVEAAARAARRLGRPLRLVVAGEGPQRAAVEALAGARGVAAAFAGWVLPAERDRLMRSAKILVVPSRWPEPFGLVGLEAAAAGTPAVAFATGGIAQWLDDDVGGRLVPPEAGADGMGDAIAGMLGDPALWARLSAGALRAASAMTLSAHVSGLVDVLAAAAAGGPRR